MFEAFERYMENMMPGITKQQLMLMRNKCVVKKVRKRHLLLHEGEVSLYKIFVVTGLLRNYSLADDGYEYVLRFTAEGGWTVDPESYYSGTPSKFYIDAIEPSEVVMFTRDNFDALKLAIPALNTFSETVMSQTAGLTQQRVLMNISASAEEKYLDFINTFPNIFNRVPLHMVASYLGVSRETLTRIRQGLAVTKE